MIYYLENYIFVSAMGLNLNYIIIYFIYGLAFFSLGLATFLESGRSPLLAQTRVLRPLSVFGFLHGIHEWLEMLFIFSLIMGNQETGPLVIARLGLLTISFTYLIAFSVRVFRSQTNSGKHDLSVSIGMLLIYSIALISFGAIPWANPGWITQADLLARYILAVPGAIFASLALWKQSTQAKESNRNKLSNNFKLASIGFMIYGFSQVFGPQTKILGAELINAKMFNDFAGFPIQIIRAGLALIIMFAIIRVIQIVQKDRRTEFFIAQQDRVEALELVQEEMNTRNKMRKELMKRIVQLQEEERIRISRELHDETAQYLTAFSTNLATLENRKSNNNSELITRLKRLADQMSLGLKRLVHDLRPAQLDELGLVSALTFLIERLHNDLGMEINFEVDKDFSRQDRKIETVLFRVAQESLINVSRHANTKRAKVSLNISENSLDLIIEDKGAGFAISEEEWSTKNLGMVGMRERVESVDGKIEFISKIGQGTKVVVNIPLDIRT
jgi:signal transduction histidine kinase